MLRSMTGFGRSVAEDTDWVQTWEIRSVNSRFLDLKWKLPMTARGLEQRFERVVRKFALRGRVEISLNLQQRGECGHLQLNEVQASSLLDALQQLAEHRGELFEPDYNMLLGLPQLWIGGEDDDAAEELHGRLEEGLAAALEDWNESRATEGSALARDMNARILQLEEWVEFIAERAPTIKEERFALLRDRLTQALGEALRGVLRGGREEAGELDESRFLQEMVILSDKLDVSEELTRLNAHLDRLRELLAGGTDVGRRLDFTLQECFREISTCGNKIQDAMVSRTVVDCKNELEKCREQVQNIE